MRTELLQIERLHVSYGPVRAIEDVSLTVRTGEIVVVIGSNGAGKTTLMKTIAGLLPPAGGTIRFQGRDIGGSPANQVVRRGLCLVPEGRQVFGHLTVRENLLLGGYSRSDDLTAHVEHAFTLFPLLRQRRFQLAGTLSGGEQQMLAIARGLMSRPTLLLMDEPSLGLAPRLVRDIFKVIADLRRAGVTILLVEQMARLALKVADRAYVLEHGRIVREGTSGELIEDSRLVGAYLGASLGHSADSRRK